MKKPNYHAPKHIGQNLTTAENISAKIILCNNLTGERPNPTITGQLPTTGESLFLPNSLGTLNLPLRNSFLLEKDVPTMSTTWAEFGRVRFVVDFTLTALGNAFIRHEGSVRIGIDAAKPL